MIRHVKAKIRKLLLVAGGHVGHLKPTVSVNKKWYGNDYGGFYVCQDLINANSIVYSFGIGEDISFDIELINNHNCRVFAFDPTPKSINWVKGHEKLPAKFLFLEYGLADKTGSADFFLPKNTDHVSGSLVMQDYVDDTNKISVNMKSIRDIVEQLDHDHINVLKMDIEGAEYNVLNDILSTSIEIDQILIEFHDRLFVDGTSKTIEAIRILSQKGYEIFGVSDSFQEVSFINKRLVNSSL